MYIYIRSMSEAQSKIYDRLTTLSWKMDEHIVKLLLLPDCQEANHWKREIVRFLYHMDRLKGKNKYPSAKFIKKCISTHNDTAEAMLQLVSSELKDANKRPISEEDVVYALDTYQNWLAEELSSRGIIDFDEAYAVLDRIVDQTR